jgi:GH35 family endo-1,4-beta-xylanase
MDMRRGKWVILAVTVLMAIFLIGGAFSKQGTEGKVIFDGFFGSTKLSETTMNALIESGWTSDDSNVSDGGLGIAAGGDLIYLNQDSLDDYFQQLKDLGVIWVRYDIDWSAIQPENSMDYDWDGTDRVVATAQRYGIKSLGVIDYAPEWARSEAIYDENKQYPPKDVDVFARFSGTVAKRYKGAVDAWEIWNEPNLELFWYAEPNAEKYSELLKVSYIEIKKADPNATVISGGLSVVGSDDRVNIQPIEFIEMLYDSGANEYCDGIAFHPYTYPVAPDYAADWNGWQQIGSIREIMENHGDGNKKIWITEYGAPTGGPGVRHGINELDFISGYDYVSENAQAEMAEEAAESYEQNRVWLGPIFWYTLKDKNDDSTPENSFGLIRSDGSEKPAYGELKNIFSK